MVALNVPGCLLLGENKDFFCAFFSQVLSSQGDVLSTCQLFYIWQRELNAFFFIFFAMKATTYMYAINSNTNRHFFDGEMRVCEAETG